MLGKRKTAQDLIILLSTLFIGVLFIPYITPILLWEFIFIGLVPIILVLYRKERFKDYGFSRDNVRKSALYGLAIVAALIILLLAFQKNITWLPIGFSESMKLSTPFNYLSLVGYFIAYYPLEVFFFIFMIKKFDDLFQTTESLISKGLIISSIIFGSILHIFIGLLMNAESGEIFSKAVIFIPFLIVGLLYKKTKNVLGSIIVWLFINGMNFS